MQPLGEDFGNVVYNYNPRCDLKFVTKTLLGESKLKNRFKEPLPKDIAEDSLVFESRFESGNLMKAVRITESYYELHLRPDLYTAKHCQWFYFRVKIVFLNEKNIFRRTSLMVSFRKINE